MGRHARRNRQARGGARQLGGGPHLEDPLARLGQQHDGRLAGDRERTQPLFDRRLQIVARFEEETPNMIVSSEMLNVGHAAARRLSEDVCKLGGGDERALSAGAQNRALHLTVGGPQKDREHARDEGGHQQRQPNPERSKKHWLPGQLSARNAPRCERAAGPNGRRDRKSKRVRRFWTGWPDRRARVAEPSFLAGGRGTIQLHGLDHGAIPGRIPGGETDPFLSARVERNLKTMAAHGRQIGG